MGQLESVWFAGRYEGGWSERVEHARGLKVFRAVSWGNTELRQWKEVMGGGTLTVDNDDRVAVSVSGRFYLLRLSAGPSRTRSRAPPETLDLVLGNALAPPPDSLLVVLSLPYHTRPTTTTLGRSSLPEKDFESPLPSRSHPFG